MSIGEVLARLREDFPDVTISKLRFLEAEGLVEPVRTAAGYRKYAPADVERLAFVLTAQRDRFLPLRVIRDHLAALDRGEPAAPLDYGFDGDAYPVRTTSDGEDDPATSGPLRRDEMLARTGLSDAELTDLEDAGLVCPRTPGWYDEDAFIVASVAARLGKHGIGVRHLRPYRSAADREVGLFAALVTPLAKSKSASARSQAAETVRELTALTSALHAALVRVGLRDTLRP